MRCLKLLFVFTILFFSGNVCYPTPYWLLQTSPTTKWLYRLSFPDSLNGWAAGDSGIIIRTSNGGTSWVIQNSNVTTPVSSVFFLNTRLGWALTTNSLAFDGTRVLTTTNGGLLWMSYRFPDTTVELYTIDFLDSSNGWAAGSQGKVFNTTNGGANWVLHPIDTSGCGSVLPVFRLGFHNNIPRYGVGGVMDYVGVAWYSTDFGQNWRGSCVGPEPLYDVIAFDSLNALCSGGDYEYGVTTVRTTNGGREWMYDTTGIFGRGESIDFRTRAEGWITAGFSGRLLLSLDSGRTWTWMFSPDSSAIYDLKFTTPYHGIAVGYNGRILKYNIEAIGISNQNQKQIPAVFFISQNFPNPFNSSTVITYSVPVLSVISLRLYDAAGKLIREFPQEVVSPGIHRFPMSQPNISSGIYFLSVNFHSPDSRSTLYFSGTKKLILLK